MEVNSTLVECFYPKSAPPKVMFHFLILDAPSPSNLPMYIRELQRRKVKHLVRVCGATYDTTAVERSGTQVHSWPFDDGAPPTRKVIADWLMMLDNEKSMAELAAKNTGLPYEAPTIGVHCVAGLGRAPILVALALVEFGQVEALDAILLIREKREGAINQMQMQWLSKYKSRSRGGDCLVM
eukprot:gene7084-5019_t